MTKEIKIQDRFNSHKIHCFKFQGTKAFYNQKIITRKGTFYAYSLFREIEETFGYQFELLQAKSKVAR